MLKIGLDVGGTFTDFVLLDQDSGEIRYHKVASTPADPSDAIRTGLADLLGTDGAQAGRVRFLGHGTTVATNIVIERKGARTALLTTRGFRDVLEIGRQTRPELYDYAVRHPEPLTPRHRRFEIDERVYADGTVETPLDENAITSLTSRLRAADIESIAVCFLHSYRHPEHEERARRILAEALPNAFICTSAEVLPEFREYERLSTTVINAFVGPRMANYCAKLATDVEALGIATEPLTFHSNGGLMSLETARRFPVRTCLSGPAAGVVGAARAAAATGLRDVVTFDVGGTSTDVSLVRDAEPQMTGERDIAGHPLKLPMLDIHVIGAGGGSIAWIDNAGALKVGPQSAGAHPGPAAYGTGGTEPTVTDANICLGRIDPDVRLAGRMPVDAAAARAAIETRIAKPLGMSVEQAAHGILRIAVANMGRAIRAVSTMRGYDLREFALMAYGGAGPLHAGDVADECDMSRILVPVEPGTLCARAMLLSDVSFDFVRTVMLPADADSWPAICRLLEDMQRQGDEWLARENIGQPLRAFDFTLEARHLGQNHEIPVQVTSIEADGFAAFLEAFDTAHERTYGHRIPDQPIEIVNCRVRAAGHVALDLPATAVSAGSLESARVNKRPVYFEPGAGWIDTPVYARNRLPMETEIPGPAIVEEMSATTVLPPNCHAVVRDTGDMVIEMTAAQKELS
jgi:N-methylhydantoinase A